MIAYALSYIIVTIMMLPVGKLLLLHQLDLTKISFFKLTLAIIAQGIFYASFVFFPAGLVTNISQMRTVWSRFIFPMWFLGGFQFSWTALHTIFPTVSYLLLFNPLIYITEAMRIALIGQEGFINFWLCMLALLFFSVLFLLLSLRVLKKRLDYV
jgi:ABC-type polysaccharide/polyol phosphate export permease